MNVRNTGSALFFFCVGVAVLWKGLHLGLRLDQNMGPGFFPILAGGALTLLSLLLLAQTFYHRKSAEPRVSFWVSRNAWGNVFLTFLVTAAYPFMLNLIGFFLSTLILLIFLFRAISRLKWWVVWTAGVIAAMSFYFVFEIWLRANLPRGFWSF